MTDFAVNTSRRRRGPRGSAPAGDWSANHAGTNSAPVPFWDAVWRGAEAGWRLDRAGAREDAWRAALWERHLLVRELTGEAPQPSREMLGTDRAGGLAGLVDGRTLGWAIASVMGDPTAEDYERQLEELLARNRRQRMVGAIDHERPGIYRDFLTRAPALDRVRSREDLWRDHEARLQGLQQDRDEAFAGGLGGAAGAFIGGAGAFVADPGYLAVGGAGAAAVKGGTVVSRMAIQAAIGVGFEATQVPGRAFDAERFGGPEYTAAQAGFELLTAGAGGALFEGAGAAAGALGRRLGWIEPGHDLARGAQSAAEQVALDERALGELDPSTLDAARAALDAGGPPPRLEPEQDLGQLFTPAEGAPFAPVRPGQGGVTPPPAGLVETTYQGRRILAGRFDPLQLETDAATFQYKAEADAEGVTARLRGVERWDATASGKIIVYERADGRLVVADGHQRRGLARRLAEQGWEDAQLDGFLFREADGWTPREVRVVAALKNIREGSGTILDAAKVFRDAPGALNDRSLPVSGDFIHQARALARLSDEAFGAVVNKVIPERHGAAIGEMAAQRPDLHMDLVRLLKEGQPTSADEARALVSEGLLDDFLAREGEQGDLFGGLPRQSTTVARGQIRAAILRILRRDERAFANLVKNADVVEAGGNILARSENEKALALERAASEVISRLALRAGPVGEAFGEAAAAVATGRTTVAKAAQGLAQRVRNALKAGEDLDAVRAETIAPEPPPASEVEAVKAFDDPAGPAAARQAEPKPEDADLEAGVSEPGLFDDLADEAGGLERAIDVLKACAAGGRT